MEANAKPVRIGTLELRLLFEERRGFGGSIPRTHLLPRRLAARVSRIARRLWTSWRKYQARLATARRLRSLDDRALADMGFKRSEIASVVFAEPSDRPRQYDPQWHLRSRS